MADWIQKPGDELDLDFKVAWAPVAGDEVNINFAPFEVCPNWWTYKLPLDIDFTFVSPDDEWTSVGPTDVDFTFTCGTAEEPSYTDFDGFIEGYTGEWATLLDLSAAYALYPAGRSGEAAQAAVSPTVSLVPAARSGEYSAATLLNNPAWTPTFVARSGENATVSVSTSDALSVAQAYTGECATLDVDDSPAAVLEGLVYAGEVGSTTLATWSTFIFRGYSGEEGLLDLETSPSPALDIDGYSGEYATVTIQFAPHLGTVAGRSGEMASTSVGTLDNYIVKTGEVGEADLATDIIIAIDQFGGEHASINLKTGPSEPLGVFRGYSGEFDACVLQTSPSAILYLNPVTQWHDAVVGFETSTSFDLLNRACCPRTDSHEAIELNEMEPPDIAYSGTKVYAVADLSARPRFYMQAYAGEHSGFVDPNWLGTFQAWAGELATNQSMEFEFHDFNLCYGNLILDSEYADAELVDLSSWDCEAHAAWSGESAVLTFLEANVQPQPLGYSGEWAYVVLDTNPAWLCLAYTGEYAMVESWPNMNGQSGEAVVVRFYEPSIEGATGEFAQVTALKTDYLVEFTELGCLDNEYLPMDEDGDPDPDRANPVPVELDYYVHSIKARCF